MAPGGLAVAIRHAAVVKGFERSSSRIVGYRYSRDLHQQRMRLVFEGDRMVEIGQADLVEDTLELKAYERVQRCESGSDLTNSDPSWRTRKSPVAGMQRG